MLLQVKCLNSTYENVTGNATCSDAFTAPDEQPVVPPDQEQNNKVMFFNKLKRSLPP